MSLVLTQALVSLLSMRECEHLLNLKYGNHIRDSPHAADVPFIKIDVHATCR